MNKFKIKNPRSPISYIFMDKPTIILIAISGTLFNVGLLTLPLFEGFLAQTLYDIIGGKKVFIDIVIVSVAFLLTMLVVQALRYMKRFFVRRMANNIASTLRKSLYRSIIDKKQVEIEEENVGGVMARGISDINAVSEGIRKFVTEFFDTGVLLIAYAVTLCLYDWKLALMCLALMPVVYILAMLLRKPIVRYVGDFKKQTENLNNVTLERIENETMFRVFSVEGIKNDEYKKQVEIYENKAVKANVLENAMQPLYKVIMLIGVIMIVFFGGKNVLGSGNVVWDIAAFTTFNLCYAKIADKVSKGAKTFNTIQKAYVSWNRILPFVENENSRKNKYYDTIDKPNDIRFENVSFRYSESSNYIFKNLSFEIKGGETVGITGGVASGKSTIGKLLLNEREYEGNIYINGRELRTISDAERVNLISYLGHRYELISGTVEENINLGDNGNTEEYLKAVCLDKELEKSGGKNAFVGNNGIMLSGGQQARLALARTLFHSKKIVILDDTFSSVDKPTEQQILKNIKKYLRDKSLIMITHRVYNFENFDKVLFIDEGDIIVSTHRNLMENPRYKKLYDAQTGVQDAK